MAMFFPIMIFAISGFEHCIANMAFIPLGLMYGATADYKNWLYQNLLLAILGNIVGGGLIVGGTTYFIFDWTKPRNAALAAKRAAAAAAAAAAPPAIVVHAQPCGKASPPLSICGSSDSDDLERARRVFQAFDTDGDGLLDAPQLALALSFLGVRLPLDLVRAAMRAAAFDAEPSARRGSDQVDLAGFEGLAWRMRGVEDLCTVAPAPPSATAAALPKDCGN